MIRRPVSVAAALLSFTLTITSSSLLAAGRGAPGGKQAIVQPAQSTAVRDFDAQSMAVLDFNEETHLVFMREEEKLARDVYTRLGMLYPDSVVFGNIDDSEQYHTDAVKQMLQSYGVEDPNSNDNTGIFTGADYGAYFTEKYTYLLNRGASSELDALYVGAFIEELDMHDIRRCPGVIVEQDNGVGSDSQCGRDYTDQPDIAMLYDMLLKGSKNHLRGYVRAIEAIIGQGAYRAQVLSQAEVDEILGR